MVSPKLWSGALQLATSVGLPTLVSGVLTLATLFSASTVENPKLTYCGVTELRGSAVRCIPTRALWIRMEPLESLSLCTSVKMGGAIRLLVNFPLMEVHNLLESLRSIANIWAHTEATGWGISGVTSFNGTPGSNNVTEIWGGRFANPTVNWSEIEMDPSMPVLILCRGVLLVHTLPVVASTNISFIAGVSCVCGGSIIAATIRFSVKDKTETSLMIRKLNMFGS